MDRGAALRISPKLIRKLQYMLTLPSKCIKMSGTWKAEMSVAPLNTRLAWSWYFVTFLKIKAHM